MENLFNSSIPASLAKRLGEAADGYRNTGTVYFVAGYKAPHKIKAFFELQEAQDFLSNLNSDEFEIFGPFDTIDELKEFPVIKPENIKSIGLHIKYNDGTEHESTLHGNIDSIFLSLSSFDKFIFPYYSHVYGVDYAKRLRDKLIAQYKKDMKVPPPPERPHLIGTLITHLNDEEETWTTN